MQINLQELVSAGVITEETSSRIQTYYANQAPSSKSRLFAIFGVLGAILVSMGIILMFAHNWDNFNRLSKTILAFLPMLIGQGLCIYVLLKKTDNSAWREAASVFLFFSVGAAIALIGQIYNIPGSLSSYLLSWMLLVLPLVYLLGSNMVALLYLGGITYYAAEVGYFKYSAETPYLYWVLLLALIPHYYHLVKHKLYHNFSTFHHWLIPLSITCILGSLSVTGSGLAMYVAYMSLFGVFYLIGKSAPFNQLRILNNGYLVVGAAGSIVLLLTASFKWFWEEIYNYDNSYLNISWAVAILLTSVAIGLFIRNRRSKQAAASNPLEGIFIVFIACYFLALNTPIIAMVLVNLLALGTGILLIRKGENDQHLGILNLGLIMIAALVACRFFDTDMSFVLRGLLFVLVGTGFFYANYRLVQKRA